MKTAAYSLLGALVGLCATVACVYLAGQVIEALGVTLYHSEADQQRNFNIALAIAVVFAGLGGWLGFRLARRPSQRATEQAR